MTITIVDYPRNLLKKALLSRVGRTWTTRDEAITAAARYLGFARTGSRIEEAFKGAIRRLIRAEALERDGDRVRRV